MTDLELRIRHLHHLMKHGLITKVEYREYSLELILQRKRQVEQELD